MATTGLAKVEVPVVLRDGAEDPQKQVVDISCLPDGGASRESVTVRMGRLYPFTVLPGSYYVWCEPVDPQCDNERILLIGIFLEKGEDCRYFRGEMRELALLYTQRFALPGLQGGKTAMELVRGTP